LFGYLNWTYKSQLIGKDISKMKPNEDRALIGNYRSLGLLQDNMLMILNDKKSSELYNWNKETNYLSPIKSDPVFLRTTLGYYHTNDFFYQNDLYKISETKQ
ncbi:MAG: LTA synthase family protein, partial [Vicingaceae bacterium]|nr:LTA synthase family protein [Vicingaceae bacterium]